VRYAPVCRWSVGFVLFFVLVGVDWAEDESLRKALDQLSVSYVATQQRLRDQEAALQTLTASLGIAQTESEMFQQLWSEAQVRVQTLGSNLIESDTVATHRQLVEALRKLYLAEVNRQRLMELLKRLVAVIELNQDVSGEIAVTKQLLADKTISAAVLVSGSTLAVAKVLDVNLKLRLVVLDVGAQNGARVGMPLIILRGDRVVAELRVVEVRPKICGALIEKAESNVTLQAGDTAQVTKG
jgi:hypothetical protein